MTASAALTQNCLDDIKRLNAKISSASISELQTNLPFITTGFISAIQQLDNGLSSEEHSVFEETVLELVKHLKILCSKGREFQAAIVDVPLMLSTIDNTITRQHCEISRNIQIKCFQLVANLCVDNNDAQQIIWNSMDSVIIAKLDCTDNDFVNVAAMILHCMILGKQCELDHVEILRTSLNHFKTFLNEPTKNIPDFVHILLDNLICTSSNALKLYKQLDASDQKTALYYIHDFIDIESNETIDKSFLKSICVEFKQKSDCILKTVPTYVDAIDPQLVVTMLDIISSASAQEKYQSLLKDDRALFLNLGCLLQILHKIGKNSDTMFSPIKTLEAQIPGTNENGDFEKEFSYSFKTKLVKSLANLAHKNKKNQELAREMEIMQSIFECTNADARNPLIKEWSILAIRNLCEGNLENQEMVKGLTKVGDAKNPLLKELGLDSGTLRIGKQ